VATAWAMSLDASALCARKNPTSIVGIPHIPYTTKYGTRWVHQCVTCRWSTNCEAKERQKARFAAMIKSGQCPSIAGDIWGEDGVGLFRILLVYFSHDKVGDWGYTLVVLCAFKLVVLLCSQDSCPYVRRLLW
jgi:hypothetical protein